MTFLQLALGLALFNMGSGTKCTSASLPVTPRYVEQSTCWREGMLSRGTWQAVYVSAGPRHLEVNKVGQIICCSVPVG